MNTTKRIACLLFACLLTYGLSAQLCWKITAPGHTESSYLFGTHHMVEPTSIPHLDTLIALCQASELFVGELPDDPQGAQKMLNAVSMPDCSLKTLLSPTDYTMVAAEIKRMLNMDISMFDEVKPLYIGTLYSMMAQLKALGLKEQPEPVDGLLRRKALERGLPAVGLETVDQQIDLLFNSFTLKRQADLLVEAIKDTAMTSYNVGLLNRAYLAGDLNTLASLGSEEELLPDEQYLMVDQRNNHWIEVLPDYLNRHVCFIAVGCLHLVGETGLIKQLRSAGFKVEPVTF